MRIPRELYQIEQLITQQFSHMRPAHVLGLALWVSGTVLAKSACLSAVVVELLNLLPEQTGPSAPARMAAQWTRQSPSLRCPGRCAGVFSLPVALGRAMVAGHHAAAGD
jgi:hypothetical protein